MYLVFVPSAFLGHAATMSGRVACNHFTTHVPSAARASIAVSCDDAPVDGSTTVCNFVGSDNAASRVFMSVGDVSGAQIWSYKSIYSLAAAAGISLARFSKLLIVDVTGSSVGGMNKVIFPAG